jgi:hypothetical protein
MGSFAGYSSSRLYKLFRGTGYLFSGRYVISVSFIICMLTLLLVPLAGLHFCVGLEFVTSSHCNLFQVNIIIITYRPIMEWGLKDSVRHCKLCYMSPMIKWKQNTPESLKTSCSSRDMIVEFPAVSNL